MWAYLQTAGRGEERKRDGKREEGGARFKRDSRERTEREREGLGG